MPDDGIKTRYWLVPDNGSVKGIRKKIKEAVEDWPGYYTADGQYINTFASELFFFGRNN